MSEINVESLAPKMYEIHIVPDPLYKQLPKLQVMVNDLGNHGKCEACLCPVTASSSLLCRPISICRS